MRIECHDRLVVIRLAVEDAIAAAEISQMRLVIRCEHSRINDRSEFLLLAPFTGCMPRPLAGLKNADGLQFPLVGIDAQYGNLRVAERARFASLDAYDFHSRSESLPV